VLVDGVFVRQEISHLIPVYALQNVLIEYSPVYIKTTEFQM
jgi:hypothetical protein